MTVMVVNGLEGRNCFARSYVDTMSTFMRKFIRGLFNSLLHLMIQVAESLSIGYTWSNYFSIMPVVGYLSNVYLLPQMFA